MSIAAPSALNPRCDAGTKGVARMRRPSPKRQNVNIPRLSSFCIQMEILRNVESVLGWDESSAGASKAI